MADADRELQRLNFEREKWQAEVRLREREIAIKEREQARSPWLNPLVVAIFTAAAAGIGNIGVAYLNGLQQRTVAETQTNKEEALEKEKSEAARILAVIQVADTERSAQNLEFLLKAGLITDSTLVASLTKFLMDRRPGQGPSVPPPSQGRSEPACDHISQRVTAVLGGEFNVSEAKVAPELNLNDLGITTIVDRFALLSTINGRLNLAIPVREAAAWTTVANVVASVEQQCGGLASK